MVQVVQKTEMKKGGESCGRHRDYGFAFVSSRLSVLCRRPGSSLLKVGCPEKFRKSDPPELGPGLKRGSRINKASASEEQHLPTARTEVGYKSPELVDAQ